MDKLQDFLAAVQSDLTVGGESTLYSPDQITLAINRAYRKAGGLFLWPETEDAKRTSTQAGYEYYDYPVNWRPYSMWMLEVDGDQYGEKPDGSPLAFKDYLIFKRDNPNSTEKKWSKQWRRFFIWPVPTVTGDNNITIWGQKVVEKLEGVNDITIFSYSMPECNEAIVLEAVAILKANKEDDNEAAAFRSAEAKQILANAWGKIQRAKSQEDKIQPFFEVPDYFSRRSTKNSSNGSPIGNF